MKPGKDRATGISVAGIVPHQVDDVRLFTVLFFQVLEFLGKIVPVVGDSVAPPEQVRSGFQLSIEGSKDTSPITSDKHVFAQAIAAHCPASAWSAAMPQPRNSDRAEASPGSC